nr:hypothetical protein [Leptospira interrogans]
MEDQQETKSHIKRIKVRTKPNDGQISLLLTGVFVINSHRRFTMFVLSRIIERLLINIKRNCKIAKHRFNV